VQKFSALQHEIAKESWESWTPIKDLKTVGVHDCRQEVSAANHDLAIIAVQVERGLCCKDIEPSLPIIPDLRSYLVIAAGHMPVKSALSPEPAIHKSFACELIARMNYNNKGQWDSGGSKGRGEYGKARCQVADQLVLRVPDSACNTRNHTAF
jgi:hypothetical protein